MRPPGMTETKVDRKFAARKVRWGIYFVMLSALFLFAASRIRFLDVWFLVSTTAFALTLCAVIWFDDFFRDIYRCPGCQTVLYRRGFATEFSEGDPICFFCERCDVNWDTGDIYTTD